MAKKRQIKIRFVDFWDDFNNKPNFFTDALSRHFDIEICDEPDYLFFGTFGTDHYRYPTAVRIFMTGENIVPDFNICDYAIGFDHIAFGDRYLRLPLFCLRNNYNAVLNRPAITSEAALRRKFCCMVVSNARHAHPNRELFFRELSKYKRVDSGGRWLNNIGAPVADKRDFLSAYKFNIAFENSAVDGYTTEKIIDPLEVNSVPIYWGNPSVNYDFNPASFINISDFTSIREAVDYIAYIDTHDDEYLKYINRPFITETTVTDAQAVLGRFLKQIIDQPIQQAKRMSAYGMQKNYFNMSKLLNKNASRLKLQKLMLAFEKLTRK